jgi:hypothetical protein
MSHFIDLPNTVLSKTIPSHLSKEIEKINNSIIDERKKELLERSTYKITFYKPNYFKLGIYLFILLKKKIYVKKVKIKKFI